MTLIEGTRSDIDFSGFKGRPESYEFGDPIRRENFYGFVILPFEIGMLNEDVSNFFRWRMLHGDADIFGVLGDFIKQGGWNLFNGEEREKFTTGFHEVHVHKKLMKSIVQRPSETRERAFERHLAQVFNGVIENAIDPDKLAAERDLLPDDEIKAMDWRQFTERAFKRVAIRKEQQRKAREMAENEIQYN